MRINSGNSLRSRLVAIKGSESFAMEDLKCVACGNLALVYPKRLETFEPVVCANCGKFVASYGELKRRSEQATDTNSGRVSGC
jgi:ribosomal protein S27E